mgnify:CR=1 FL=1
MASSNFRAGVVAVVTNSRGQLLAFERSDVPDAWQLPQGELEEETGLGPDQVDLVDEYPDWVVYEFPESIRSAGKRLGQAQRWYLFRVRSDDVTPTPDGVEFVAWKWVDPTWLLDHVVEFRLASYRTVIPRLVP